VHAADGGHRHIDAFGDFTVGALEILRAPFKGEGRFELASRRPDITPDCCTSL